MVRGIQPENDRHDRCGEQDPAHKPSQQKWHAEDGGRDPVDEERADQHGQKRQQREGANDAHQLTRYAPPGGGFLCVIGYCDRAA